jgi:phosphate transport system substrate-binding protein
MTAKSVATGVLIVVLAVGMIGVVGGCGRRAQESPAVSVEPPPMPEPPMPPAATGSIKMIGSTTVLPIAEAWQKKFNEMHPEVNIAVSGGGSGGGIEALLTGTADIGNASRAIKDKEKKRAEEAGMNVVEHTVAYDGIAVLMRFRWSNYRISSPGKCATGRMSAGKPARSKSLAATRLQGPMRRLRKW